MKTLQLSHNAGESFQAFYFVCILNLVDWNKLVLEAQLLSSFGKRIFYVDYQVHWCI
jgi:hypothetical protein